MGAWERLTYLISIHAITRFTVAIAPDGFTMTVIRADGRQQEVDFWHDEDLMEFLESLSPQAAYNKAIQADGSTSASKSK